MRTGDNEDYEDTDNERTPGMSDPRGLWPLRH